MTARGRTVVAALSLAAFVAMLAGCQKEGPMERAGKDVDKAIKKVTQRIEPMRTESGSTDGSFNTH